MHFVWLHDTASPGLISFFTIPWAFVWQLPTACFRFPTLSNVFSESFLVTADRCGNPGISYPNQHIDSDCFFCGSAYFRALLAYDTLRRTSVELEHKRQDPSLSRRGMHYEHSTHSLFCKHAAWGAIDSRFPSRPHADDLTQHFLNLRQKRFLFFPVIPSAIPSFSSSLFVSVSSHAESSSMAAFGTTEKFAA